MSGRTATGRLMGWEQLGTRSWGLGVAADILSLEERLAKLESHAARCPMGIDCPGPADEVNGGGDMLRERGNHSEAPNSSPNLDAAPEAIAPEPEPSAARRRPAGGTGGTDHGASPEARASVGRPRTDKADLPTLHGTGDTPVTEPMPQRKLAEVSAEPAAWYVRDRAAGPPMLFWDEERAKKAAFACGVGARPLYLCQVLSRKNLTLTDAEREAVEFAATHLDNCGWGSATLRGLLERLGGGR